MPVETTAEETPPAPVRESVTDDDAVYDDFCLANGLGGEALAIPSANPTNFHQAISHTDAMPRQDLSHRPTAVRHYGASKLVADDPGAGRCIPRQTQAGRAR